MQVLALNGSPRKERGATSQILSLFLEGVREAGADVEIIYTHDLDMKPCRGCFTCWTTTPGKCVIDDEVKDILPKIANADIIIYATPVYVDGMTSTLKMLLDRSLPLIEGKWEIRDDHCRHPRRETTKTGKNVLLSVSGFTELDNFDPLIVHMKAACKNEDREYVGAILRPVAWLIPIVQKQGFPVDDIFEALREAGRQIVQDGKFKEETLQIISKDLISKEELIPLINEQYP